MITKEVGMPLRWNVMEDLRVNPYICHNTLGMPNFAASMQRISSVCYALRVEHRSTSISV